MSWTRPETAEYPSVWRRFETKSINGKIFKFRIEDATIDMLDMIVNHLAEYFLNDEPLTKCLCARNDEATMKDFQKYWEKEINNRALLVCFEDNFGDMTDEMVACNLTGVRIKNKPSYLSCTGRVSRIFQKIMSRLMLEDAKIFETFNVDKYLTAYGLSVKPEFRGMGIGVQILNARTELCRALDLPLTATPFSSKGGQIAAIRAGFQLLLEKKYTEIEEELDIELPGITHDCVKVMYKKIDL